MFRDRLRGGRPTSDAVAEFLRITDPRLAMMCCRLRHRPALCAAQVRAVSRHHPGPPCAPGPTVSEQMQDDGGASALCCRAQSVRPPVGSRFTDYYRLWQLSDPKIVGYDLIVVDEAKTPTRWPCDLPTKPIFG